MSPKNTDVWLSSNERRVLAALHLDADLKVDTLRTLTKLKTHTVHYTLARLKERKIIRWLPYVDIYALGMHYTMILFSVAANDAQRRQLTKTILQNKTCTWFAEIGGQYHYGITLATQSSAEAAQVFATLIASRGLRVINRSIAVRTRLTDIHRGYLWPYDEMIRSAPRGLRLPPKTRDLAPIPQRMAISEAEQQVLTILNHADFTSYRAVGLTSGMPLATFESRIKALRMKKILLGSTYLINPTLINRHAFKLIIQAQQPSPSLYGKLLAYTQMLPEAYHLVEAFGDWDYELNVEVAEPRAMTQITQNLYRDFPSEIRAIESLPLVWTGKFLRYPG